MAARNAMEIFSLLDKSNCRKCGEKTCLAFAGAVYTGRRSLEECPLLGSEERSRVSGGQEVDDAISAEAALLELKNRLTSLDFTEAAARCGGTLRNDILTVKILGKDFGVDRWGNFHTAIHVISWVVMPFLAYVLEGRGAAPTGRWLSLRELKGGRERYPLFQKRTEDDMCRIADTYPDFFADIIQMFDADEVESQFASDVSVVLHPLPKVPIMICYWKPDEGIESSLNLFFDATVDENLGIDGIYSLCAGLVAMFNRLSAQHGFTPQG